VTSAIDIRLGQFSTPGAKNRNDDSYGVVVPSAALAATHGIAIAIADGLSSADGGKEASESIVKAFLDDYYATPPSWPVKKSVGTIMKATNAWLHGQGQRRVGGLMTTFSGIVVKAATAHIFHVGDSRISRLRAGRLEPLTRDHRSSAAGAGSTLSRALGADQHIEVDYRAEPIEAGDVLLLTTDGVHDHVSTSDIVAAIGAHTADLDAAARALSERAAANGSADNLTCQVIRIDHPGRPDEAAHLGRLSQLEFPPELAPGMRFDGYRIIRELHASKRTQVYLVEDAASGATAVMKTPSVNFEDDPAYIEMFAREEWIGRLVESPHVVKVPPAARPRRHLYTITEYFDAQTLRHWMHDNPSPPLEAVRSIVEQIAKGVRAFHRKDILHQDLKPENIMIDRHGLVKIIDFGSARAAGFDEMASPVPQPHLAGTVDYSAPEYFAGGAATNRADIYALGAISYELLTGRLPYGRGFASARDVAKARYVPAVQWRGDIPVWVDAALAQAVALRPAARTEALSALVENLRRPNPSLGYDRPRPLIERNPVGFWRAIALTALAVNLLLAFLLTR
jgi:eukaryotic-like serine/threonine-protein kinase